MLHLPLQPGVWAAYTPVLTASTTNPTLGNGTILGRYMQIGKTVWCSVRLAWGSTSTVGSGIYRITLPVTAASDYNDATAESAAGGLTQGARIFDTDGGGVSKHYYGWRVRIRSGLDFDVAKAADEGSSSGVSGAYTDTVPVVPADGDTMQAFFVYEAA